MSQRDHEPLISVIVPVYDAERCDPGYLTEALDSIARQSYRRFELIVVNDGSTDHTLEMVHAFAALHPELSISALSKENGGQSSARNFGAAHARGDWLAFLDQDDVWFPQRLDAVLPLLTAGTDLVYTDADVVDAEGSTTCSAIHVEHALGGVHPKARLEDVLFEDVFIMPGIMTIRSAFFRDLGGFDEDLSGYEDDDLVVRSVAAGCIRYVPLVTLQWRQYGANYSHTGRMVRSRMRFWRKLMNGYARTSDPRVGRAITLRFATEFLSQCDLQLQHADPLAAANLDGGLRLLEQLSPVDRAAFRVSAWAWRRRGATAARARAWLLAGMRANARVPRPSVGAAQSLSSEHRASASSPL